jgi:hypothetical protein
MCSIVQANSDLNTAHFVFQLCEHVVPSNDRVINDNIIMAVFIGKGSST